MESRNDNLLGYEGIIRTWARSIMWVSMAYDKNPMDIVSDIEDDVIFCRENADGKEYIN